MLDRRQSTFFPALPPAPRALNRPLSGSYLDATPALFPGKTSRGLRLRAFNWSTLWMAALDLKGLVLAVSSLLHACVPGIWPCHFGGPLFFLLPWLISFKPVEMTEPLSFLNFFFTLLSSRAEFMNEFKKASWWHSINSASCKLIQCYSPWILSSVSGFAFSPPYTEDKEKVWYNRVSFSIGSFAFRLFVSEDFWLALLAL